MSKTEAVIIEAMEEQQTLIAAEKLGGNIVKEEFHKGALFGLRVAMAAIEEYRTASHNDKEVEIKRECSTCGRKRYLTCDQGLCDTNYSGWIPI